MKKDFELEFYKNETIRLQYLVDNQVNMDDVNQIVGLAKEMRELLEECRYNSLPITLSKKIDNLLRRCEKFD